MNMTKWKKISIIFTLLVILFLGLGILKQGKWDRYYKNKMGQPPREIIVEALNLFKKQGKAIDLGCGVGNEAVFLLNKGWEVWAIDSEHQAIQIINKRNDIKEPEKLTSVVNKFEEESVWDALPDVDFIYASYSLPFCNQSEFKRVWSHVKQKLIPGGRFAGHFFGLNYLGFPEQEVKEMTFLKREEVLSLFQDFDVESFKEFEEDGQSGTGRQTHSHIFEIIARKK
jgi:SAM-dependent methyltransferase